DYESIDIPKLMQSFYKHNKDQYDFVTVFSNFDLQPIPGAQAFALVVQNDVSGIGNPSQSGPAIFKDNRKYGSSGKLQNVTFFGNVHQYPSDPRKPAADTQLSLLQMLAHEVAHRWLAYAKLQRDGRPSGVLLGRDDVHWSFFYNSHGSFLEGNDIAQR